MIKVLLKRLGIFTYLKFLKATYFPSEDQKNEKQFKQARLTFYRQFIAAGDLCFDVGANIGNRSEVFLELGSKVVAVEPQLDCIHYLEIRFGKKIDLEKCALGEREGEGTIYTSNTSEISSLSREWISAVSKSRFTDKKWVGTQQIKISTLNKLIAKYGVPKFCKIDVEGFEENVLKGLSHCIPVISFEYTIPERLTSVTNCLDLLSRLGDFECNYTIGENMHLESSDWLPKEKLIEKISALSSKILFGDIYIRFRQ